VYLPVTAAAQQEASEKMTLAAHLVRDPGLVKTMPYHVDLLWGLAWLSLKPAGRMEIARLINTDPANLPSPLTQNALRQLLSDLLQNEGAQNTLSRLEGLASLGYQAARDAGASFSPFFASHLRLPPMPENDNPDRWWAYMEEAAEAMLAGTDFDDPTFGPQLLSAKTRERNRWSLPFLAGPRGLAVDAADRMIVVRHTQVEGMKPAEAFACVAGARRGFAEILLKNDSTSSYSGMNVLSRPPAPTGWNVLSRARRARRPGIVFARAAASGELDPLQDMDSRLRVGGI
jgi:hypothetical protein